MPTDQYPAEAVKAVQEPSKEKRTEGKPVPMVKRDDCRELLGIATPFDLM